MHTPLRKPVPYKRHAAGRAQPQRNLHMARKEEQEQERERMQHERKGGRFAAERCAPRTEHRVEKAQADAASIGSAGNAPGKQHRRGKRKVWYLRQRPVPKEADVPA